MPDSTRPVIPPEEMTEAQRLIAAAKLLSSAVFVGRPVPYVEELARVMRDPKPGDLVWESTTQYRSLRDPEHAATALGWFVRYDEKLRCTDGVCREMGTDELCEDCPLDPVTVIRPWFDPTQEFTWGNCEFFVLPLNRM